VFSRYFRVDESLRSNKQVLSLLKLAIYLSTKNPKVNEVKFRAHDAPNPQVDSNLYVDDGDLKTVYREFMSPEVSAAPRKEASKRQSADAGTTKTRRKSHNRSASPVSGLEDTRTEGENMAVIADPKLDFPFYFPGVRVRGSTYAGTEPRIYSIKDETGKKRQAYRMVLHAPGVGEYYGVQGLTWKAPPILDDPDRTVTRNGRKLKIYYDGRNVRLVAWKTKNAVYWISNTLTQGIGEAQMLEIAGSLRKLKQ
jgi:polyisoprenyl-teichoic acid--peptidoglycan teichoic acid transferase